MKLKLSEIVIDDLIYPRSKVNEYNVQRMVYAFESGAKFPPLIVEAGTYRLIDGRHRYSMFERKGVTSVSVTEKVYASEPELFADAVRLNIEHGQPLDQFSIRSSVAKLREYGYELAAIGEIVRVPIDHLEKVIKGFAVSADGQAVALKGGLSHMRGQNLNPSQIEVNRSYAGGKAAFYARQIADILDADLWPTNSPAFVDQMDRLTAAWLRLKKSDAA